MRSGFQDSKGFFVQRETSVVQLARDVAQEFASGASSLRLHTHVDEEASVNVLAKALATAPSLQGNRRLHCIPNIVGKGLDTDRTRIFVCVRSSPGETLPEPTGSTFTALPPGAHPDPEFLRRFVAAVHDRLYRGDDVSIECRGPDAVAHAMRALCQLQGNTAEFEVNWEESQGQRSGMTGNDKSSRMLSVLRLRARRGVTWAAFSATDFTKTEVRFATPNTPVKKLAWAVAAEARRRGAVAVHAYSDNKQAMNVALKALATVPLLTDGETVRSVPSYGWTKAKEDGSRGSPVLRLYVRSAKK